MSFRWKPMKREVRKLGGVWYVFIRGVWLGCKSWESAVHVVTHVSDDEARESVNAGKP